MQWSYVLLGENTPYWAAVKALSNILLDERLIKYQKARIIITQSLLNKPKIQ